MIYRILSKKLEETTKSVLLLGARQVGKSTLIGSLKPDFTIDLSDEKTYLDHLKDPGLLKRVLDGIGLDKKKKITVDEIQRIPSMLNTIQSLIDKNKNLQFFLTGSSARKLKRGQANLLPGRVLFEKLNPLCYWEVQDILTDSVLKQILISGSLPGVFTDSQNRDDILESYTETYLREEIQAEALTKDLGAYGRFLDLAAEVSGQYINYSKLSSDSEINKETVRRYFAILEETLIVNRISSFTDIKSNRKVRQKDKFIFFDLGVRNAVLKKNRSEFTQNELGKLFEQWVLQQILTYMQYYKKHWKISTFRDENDNEVDILIQTNKKLYAIEVKYSQSYKPEHSKGIYKFQKLLRKNVSGYILNRSDQIQKIDKNILVVPTVEFLKDILPNLD